MQGNNFFLENKATNNLSAAELTFSSPAYYTMYYKWYYKLAL